MEMRFYAGEQSEIARKIGISKSYLSSIIKGRMKCPGHLAIKLEEATGGRVTLRQWCEFYKGGKDAEGITATQG